MIRSTVPADSAHEGMPRIFSILWERRMAVILCMIASLAVALVGYVQSPTRYKAETVLAIDVRKLQALPTESVVSPLPQDSPVLRTELDIIGSRSMAERVATKLQMETPSGEPLPRDVRAIGISAASQRGEETQALIDQLMKNVRVMNDGRSNTIYINYTDPDPVYAATVANAFGQGYIDYQIDLQITATRRVSDWLGERLVTLRTKLEDSERSATEFRENSGLVATGGTTLQDQQLTGLNVELTSLRAKLAGAKARLAIATQVKETGDPLGLGDVLSSPAIQPLRAEQARIVRQIEEINKSGATLNSQLPQLMTQLATLKRQIDVEIDQVIDSLRNEISVNERQMDGIQRSVALIQTDMAKTRRAAVQADQLDREAAANRTIYETYLARYKQTIEQDGIATAEARIISKAMPSSRPTDPSPALFGVIGLLLGIGTSVVTALILNFTDRSIRNVAALERTTGLPVIGRIPRQPAADGRAGPVTAGSPAGLFHNAIADLQVHLRVCEPKRNVIAISSSRDNEGKTFVVAALARLVAKAGSKVLVIEANMRSPRLAREFDVQTSSHLAAGIAKSLDLDDVVHHDRATGVDLIVARLSDDLPDMTLGSQRFAALVAEARQSYDFVLIDTPAAMHRLDLMRVALLADAVAFVLRKGTADSTVLEEAIKTLTLAGRHICGIILNGSKRKSFGGRPSRPARPQPRPVPVASRSVSQIPLTNAR